MKIEIEKKIVVGKIILTKEERQVLEALESNIHEVCAASRGCDECPFCDSALCELREVCLEIDMYNKNIE